MAPTSARRSGHSRRAQYGLFTGYVLAAIGAAVGAVLLGISLWRPSSFNGLREAAADTVAPVGQASAATQAAMTMPPTKMGVPSAPTAKPPAGAGKDVG